MDAKAYLSRIKELSTKIKNKNYLIGCLEKEALERATNITANISGERVQSSGSKQRMADAVDRGRDRIIKLEKQRSRMEAEMDAIIADIDSLPERESDILHKVYVQNMSLKEVAATRGESKSTVETGSARAHKMISDILGKRNKAKCN